jgi:superfamily II DNA or RNA helicase
VAALDKKFTIVTLPTGGGKTFVIGLLFSYYKLIRNKSVIVVVPSEELRL